MSAISDHLKQASRDLEATADVIEALETERDYWRRQATEWAEVVDRQGLSYAEQVKLDEFDAQLPA